MADPKSRTVTSASRVSLARTLAFVGLSLAASTAFASDPGDLTSDFTINEQNPSASIPTPAQREAKPLEFGYWLQDMILRGETAVRQKQWDGAVKYYEALAKAVPERAVSFSRLCMSYGELGKLDIASANCGKAIQLGGATVVDHFRFVNFTLAKKQLTQSNIEDMDASITHVREHAAHMTPEPAASAAPVESDAERIKRNFMKLRAKQAEQKGLVAPGAKSGEEDPIAKTPVNLPLEVEMLGCKIAARLEDVKRLDACVAGLKRVNAPEALMLPYQWSRAVVAKDPARASRLLEHAKSIGFPEKTVESMREEQSRLFAPRGLAGHLKRWGFAWLGGALLLAVMFVLARRSTLLAAKPRKVSTAPPT